MDATLYLDTDISILVSRMHNNIMGCCHWWLPIERENVFVLIQYLSLYL